MLHSPHAKTEIQELSEFIRDHLPTKDDVRTIISSALDEKPINQELASIRRDLDRLTANVENMVGYRKEIDYALERITAIEKHLGIENKVAA